MTAVSTMARSGDNERLPWLEPYRERRARPAARRQGRLLAALGGGLALIAALAGGYWLGERRVFDRPAPSSSASNGAPGNIAIVPVAPPPSAAEPPLPAVREPIQPPAPTVAVPAARSDPSAAVAPPKRKATGKRRPPVSRRAQPARDSFDAVRARQEGSATVPASARSPAFAFPVQSRPAPRVWPRLPSPGPAGRVIQLGAFSHPDRAYSAYRARLASYPGLHSMPRVIVPIAPQSAGGKIYYVLRLGTNSRNQSKSVCRSIKRRGDHCIVIG